MSFFEPPPPPKRPQPRELPERQPWWGTPENELGSPVPLRLILARTDRLVLAVLGAVAYSTGVAFTLSVHRRLALDADDLDAFYDDPFDPPFGHRGVRMRRRGEVPEEVLRFGVQFADGRKATTLGPGRPWEFDEEEPDRLPEGPVLMEQGGGGGSGHYDQEFWLWPLPPPGPFSFVVEWPAEKIELTRHDVDSSLFLEAARESEVLWPEQGVSGWSSAGQFVLETFSAQGDFAEDEIGDEPDSDAEPGDHTPST